MNRSSSSPRSIISFLPSSIHSSIHLFVFISEDVSSLLKSLSLFEYDDEASYLQEEYSKIESLIEMSIAEIWPPQIAQQTAVDLSSVSVNIIRDS